MDSLKLRDRSADAALDKGVPFSADCALSWRLVNGMGCRLMSDTSYQSLQITFNDGIARLKLMRPEMLNRFDERLHEEFTLAIEEIGAQPDVAALLISAEGKVFSAGGDFDMIGKSHEQQDLRDKLVSETTRIYEGIMSFTFPVIAAVAGSAIGFAATLVSLADIVVAARQARIADPHVVLGLVAGDGGIIGWSQSVGINRAKRYLLTGDYIIGEQVYEIGLVTDLVDEPDEVEAAAERIAARIASLPRAGVAGTKKAFARLSRLYAGDVFKLALDYEMETLSDPDVLNAVNRMLKRW